MLWAVEFLNAEVLRELEAFPADIRASFERIVRLIEAVGLEKVHEPYIKHLEGRLWEMRLKGRDGIARAIYVTIAGPGALLWFGCSGRRRKRHRGVRSN